MNGSQSIPPIITYVASCDRWGGLSLPSTVVGLVNQVTQVANVTLSWVPWVGIAIAPISFHGVIHKVRRKWQNAYNASGIADAVFWGMQGISSLGKAISRSIQPLIGSLGLAGFRTAGTAEYVFQRVLPITMLVTSSIGLLASTWAFGKRVKDYTKHRLPRVDKIREFYEKNKKDAAFRRLYRFHDFDLNSLPNNEEGNQRLYHELKKGLYFNTISHIRNIVAAILGLTGSVLIIAAPQYHIISGALFISSSGLELLSLIVKNSLMYKSRRMLRSELCAPKHV